VIVPKRSRAEKIAGMWSAAAITAWLIFVVIVLFSLSKIVQMRFQEKNRWRLAKPEVANPSRYTTIFADRILTLFTIPGIFKPAAILR
jgi:hypothetical protein